ncbi:uncharacterized protein C8Q71DRAFT_551184 [Rhodofomes roseus]|uniref:Uncharacterized protein n=1 Tax=Rhodofomes roseus TaxID=34475 RepID=A0ABQ8KHZ9_9APHY|nr:uncharacterized protein C8Q71DRAFT_551184 [Rhodofomes roseus]KAH9837591.1 hypothetical protein C8Q71DRAFT_551184 [Rhodofomes roseus]
MRCEVTSAATRPLEGVPATCAWNDEEIVETSTVVDEAEDLRRTSLRRAVYTSSEDEILQTSAGVGEADYVYGHTFQRAVGSGRPAPHRHTDSENTQSTASLETVQEGSEDIARPRAKTWSDLVATLDKRHSRGWKPASARPANPSVAAHW